MIKPTAFVGSSSDGWVIAEEPALLLDDAADVTLWNDGAIACAAELCESLRFHC